MYGNLGTRVPGYPDTRVRLIRSRSNAKRGAKGVWYPGYPGIQVPVSAGTRVPGTGSASNAPHQVGCPVTNLEAGVQLYIDESQVFLESMTDIDRQNQRHGHEI